MEVSVINIEGKESGKKVTLDDNIFGVEPNDHAIYLDVKLYNANNRTGNAKSKQRAEISGSTKKIKRQKGTGTARAGSIKSPLFRGGGTVFGPQPRDYSFKLNKKVRKLAKKSALAYKLKNEKLLVLENFNLEQPKTKEFFEILEKIGVSNEKSLFLLPQKNDALALSSRNIPNAKVIIPNMLSTYEVLNADRLILVEGAEKELEKLLN